MKIDCRHGYFVFEELRSGEFSDFVSRFGLPIARSGDHFTFEDLVAAPEYSIAGSEFLGCPTTVTFEGRPWEVMRANEIVYDFTTGKVVPIAAIARTAELKAAGNYFVSDGMLLPGSIREDGSRVRDYAAYFLFDRLGWKYSEVSDG